jgi:hypothetical protein
MLVADSVRLRGVALDGELAYWLKKTGTVPISAELK